MSNILEAKDEMFRRSAQLLQNHREEKWEPWPVSRKTADSALLMYGTALTIITGSVGLAAFGPAPAPAVIGAGLAGGIASGVAVYVGHKALTITMKAADALLPSSNTLAASIEKLKVASATFSAAVGMNPSAKALIEESKALGDYFEQNSDVIFNGPDESSDQRMRGLIDRLINEARDQKLLKGDHSPIKVTDLEAVVRGIDLKGVNQTLHKAFTLAGTEDLTVTSDCSILDALKGRDRKKPDLESPEMGSR